MKISVVIPAWNEERTIGACLEALQRQTMPPHEIIVVDNNCIDGTVAIARRFPVRIIREAHPGMIAARNTGFDAVTGEIIARTDADCRPPRDWIERVQSNFLEQPIDALSGPLTYYDLPGRHAILCNLFMIGMRVSTGTPPLAGPNYALARTAWERVRERICEDDRRAHEDIDLSLHIHRVGLRVHWDPTLVMPTSARRILKNPVSFFGEYPLRLGRMLVEHRRQQH